MVRPPEEDIYHEFFKAKHTTQYLENYVDQHSHAGQTLRDRIRFCCTVSSIRKADSKWVISCNDISGNSTVFHANKVVVACGVTSTPNIPKFIGEKKFGAPLIHHYEFGQSAVLSSAEIRNVTVVGGSKSAADMVLAAVKAGKNVSWIIRRSGAGPGWFVSHKGKGPYRNVVEIGSTRFFSTFSPSILNPENWLTRFLHGTKWGATLVDAIWGGATHQALEAADYDGRPRAKLGFGDLKPHTPLFWQNAAGGILNQPDFWENIAKNVSIFHDDIVELDDHIVRLKGGEDIATDVILCGTGWNPNDFSFFDTDLLVRLGLPHSLKDVPSSKEAERWAQLEKQADEKVLKQFPLLANPPHHFHEPIRTTAYRLYNGIAPLNDDSIAFVGYTLYSNHFRGAECQAVWAIAYLDKQLNLPSIEDQQLEVARQVAWCRRRYLSHGVGGNFVPFESEAYTDKILGEIGLSSHRKGFLRDLFMPTGPRDLVGLKDEYLDKFHRHMPESKDMNLNGAPLSGGKSVMSYGWVFSLRDLLHSLLK
ncbi:MAG: hypothetical protein L6R38_008080 [Xanthoria sp. 2 TBL-2021]|nr:MAG: hypothetical protein L6R38_008080 [Xanthoria sp. 2 TBL-2021]